MKRIALILIIGVLAVAMAPAQSVDIAAFQTQFETFATAVAGTLASTATLTGLNWAPAYIGQIPHFGLGVSVGAGLIPYAAVAPIFTLLGVQLPSNLSMLTSYGIPLPGAAVDFRLGGLILPFDIGVKFGYIPPEVQKALGNLQIQYLMAGGDVRLALLKDEGLMPALSVGVGYTFFKGNIGLSNILPGDTVIDVTSEMNTAGYAGPHTLRISSPDLGFNWQSNVLEAKVQVSKKLLILVPTVGLSAAYGISNVGGGLTSTLTSDQNELPLVEQIMAKYGYPVPDATGVTVSSASTGWSLRAFGGLGISLLFLDLDVNASYNILTQSLGGGVNVRIQL
jgi:hypothetical protein